ncbi:MAG: hypothetical protein KA536_06550 [Saprospiraceae bacterium]|nr:hypothetical protein [Saprospiraceae bacterium]
MTKEFILRTLSQLNEFDIQYLIVGSLARYLRGHQILPRDFDILVLINEKNLSALDTLINVYFSDNVTISDDLKLDRIIRVKSFPFSIDILPKLNGLKTETLFNNREILLYEGNYVPVISIEDLNINYQSILREF